LWHSIRQLRSAYGVKNANWYRQFPKGHSGWIREQLLNATSETSDGLKQLLRGETIGTYFHEQTVFRDLDRDAQTLWSFLLFSGYLTVVGSSRKNNRDFYQLAIPNREVLLLFQDIIQGWLRRRVSSSKVTLLLESLVGGGFETFGAALAELVRATLSYYDTASNISERVYHAFVLGLLEHLGDRYDIRSNRESGLGRYDLMMLPRDKADRGVILEFKVAAKPEALEDALVTALTQIKTCDYGAELEAAGVPLRSQIAVAFCGKEVRVRGREIRQK